MQLFLPRPVTGILLKSPCRHCSLQILVACRHGIRGCPQGHHHFHFFPVFLSLCSPLSASIWTIPCVQIVCLPLLLSCYCLPLQFACPCRNLFDSPKRDLSASNSASLILAWEWREQQLWLPLSTASAPELGCGCFCFRELFSWVWNAWTKRWFSRLESHTELLATCSY